MVQLDIIIKVITLLNRERELGDNLTDNSNDLIKTIITSIKGNGNKKLYDGGDSEILDNLIHLTLDMVNNPDNYDKDTLLQSLDLIVSEKPNLLKVIDKSINVDLSIASLKRTIISLRNTLNNYYKEQQIKSALSKASYQLTTNSLDGVSIGDFTNQLITNLEALSNATRTKDPGIMDELDVGDDENMTDMLDKVKTQTEDNGRIKTAWKGLNDMLGGGFRYGEFFVNTALQHNYKSGLVQSLFMQLPIYNKPVMRDPTKKPLSLLISFEDDAEIIVNFMYKYLYNAEHGKAPDIKTVTSKEMGLYIKEKLSVNGYHIKILRVNPSDWTYKHLFNKILEYEANGFELHFLFLDYLSKLPTTGCITVGPMGTDIRDLFNRVRNFTSSRKAFAITPHQMSMDANQLLRNGVPPQDIPKEVANKNYYEGTKQIGQVVDGELHQQIAWIKKEPFLCIQRGKRRFPEIIPEELKYIRLPFPLAAPILPDIDPNGNPISYSNETSDTTSLSNSNDKQPETLKSEFEF